jgi:hypothetical protein
MRFPVLKLAASAQTAATVKPVNVLGRQYALKIADLGYQLAQTHQDLALVGIVVSETTSRLFGH